MRIELMEHQRKAVNELHNGAILRGGVGSGKSITSLAYFIEKECVGEIGDNLHVTKPKKLYIITTARKRDELEWHSECAEFSMTTDPKVSLGGIKVTIDSWQNIKKYIDTKKSFFIFDEQRLVGSGAWVRSFIKIAKKNNWIVLSATPGDTWMDYVPVFIANGFYKNRTQFKRRHVVYNRFTKYPKIDRYIEQGLLLKYRKKITVNMDFKRHTTTKHININVDYNEEDWRRVTKERWDIYEGKPIKNHPKLFHLMRKVVNSDPSRIEATRAIIETNDRVIIFYNFDYELELLRELGEEFDRKCLEWNGHNHESIPDTEKWIYLVQYTSGAEGWNCTSTDTMVFYSQNYAYKIMHQAAGRTDRLNTPFDKLYYYHLRSNAPIDIAIKKAVKKKGKFQEKTFKV